MEIHNNPKTYTKHRDTYHTKGIRVMKPIVPIFTELKKRIEELSHKEKAK